MAFEVALAALIAVALAALEAVEQRDHDQFGHLCKGGWTLMRQRNTPEPGAILANGPGVHGTVCIFLFLKGISTKG